MNPLVVQMALVLLAIGAVVSVGVGAQALAAGDELVGEEAATAVKERMFWLTTSMALIFSYTTFESLFRNGEHRFLSQLPLSGRAWFRATLLRSSLTHGLLLVPVLAYGASLKTEPLRQYALLWGTLTLVMGLPVAMWLHMLAGASLTGEKTAIKRYLGGGLAPAESTFLLYSPVAALAATMIVGIFSDLFLYESIVTGRIDALWAPVTWSLLLAGIAMRAGSELAENGYFAMMAAFRQAEAPLPYREDGLPARTAGEKWQRLLPSKARPYFLRDLKQLRRRYRLDKVILWLYPLVLLRLSPEPGHVVETHLATLAAAVGVFWVSSFRLLGHELASAWLMKSLPHHKPNQWGGHGMVALIYPFWAWALTTVSALWLGQPVDGAWVAGIGFTMVLVFTGLTQLLARLAFPERVAWAGGLWRLFLLCVIGVVAWQMQ